MRILVVEARGLPAGFLGCYGNEWVATPYLDRLAAEGIVFDQHIAEAPDYHDPSPTWQRHALPGVVHQRVPELRGFARQAAAAWSSAKDTAITWIDGPDLAPPWLLTHDLLRSYFDDEDEATQPWPDPLPGLWTDSNLDEYLRLHDTFAAVITYFDAQLEELAAAVQRDDDVILCVTSRCGLPLGEHGMIGYERAWLHEELVHLPLLLHATNAAARGIHRSGLTQPGDLIEILHGGHGAAPLPDLSAGHRSARDKAWTRLSRGASSEWSLRTSQWALLLPVHVPTGDPPRPPQLFSKPEDRWEVNDLRQQHLDLADEMEAELRAHFAAVAGAADTPAATP